MAVEDSDQTTTLPPLPSLVALAEMRLGRVTTVVVALRISLSLPCQPPPMRMRPPPVPPSACSCAPAMVTDGAVTEMFPP